MAKALTIKAVEAVSATNVRREVPDGLVVGLYLVIQPSGAKSWAVRYRSEGRPRKLTIGAWPRVELAQARELAREALLRAAKGHDPAGEKQAAKRTDPIDKTFGRLCDAFVERHVRSNLRSSTATEMERILAKNVLPYWQGRAVDSISRTDVVTLLDRLVDRGASVSANRTLAVVRKFFNWALERGAIATSPCERIRAPAFEESRDRVLAEAELAALWMECSVLGYPFGPFVQMLMLTGQRLSEVAQMRWDEVNLDDSLWVIPRERAKNDRRHEVSLGSAAKKLLETLPRIAGNGFVFTTTGTTAVSGFSKMKARLDERMSRRLFGVDTDRVLPDWRLHDLRRTMASGMARLGVNLPVIERILNHHSGSFGGIVGVYQRYEFLEERHMALQQWGTHILQLSKSITTGASDGSVDSTTASLH